MCKQKVKRERERQCLCELQHHHSSTILLTIECRVPVRTRRKHFSWVMEKRGLGWTAWLQFFRFQGLLSLYFPKFRAQERKGRRGNRQTENGRRRRIWRDVIKVKTEMNLVCPAFSFCSFSSFFSMPMNVHTGEWIE